MQTFEQPHMGEYPRGAQRGLTGLLASSMALLEATSRMMSLGVPYERRNPWSRGLAVSRGRRTASTRGGECSARRGARGARASAAQARAQRACQMPAEARGRGTPSRTTNDRRSCDAVSILGIHPRRASEVLRANAHIYVRACPRPHCSYISQHDAPGRAHTKAQQPAHAERVERARAPPLHAPLPGISATTHHQEVAHLRGRRRPTASPEGHLQH